jgi:hypothetical protein
MVAQLSICTKEEQRAVVHSLWAEGVKGDEIHRHKKLRGRLSQDVIFLHDNACPHSASQELKSEALVHSPYSPDNEPSDFHVWTL